MRISRSTVTRIWSFKVTGEGSRQTILAQTPGERLTTPHQDSEAEEHCKTPLDREDHFGGMCQQVKNDLEKVVTTHNKSTERPTEEPFSFSQLGLDII